MAGQLQHVSLAAICAVGLGACQTSRAGEPAPRGFIGLASNMHPEVKDRFLNDYRGLVLDAGIAKIMEKSCPNHLRVKAGLRQSMNLTIQASDSEFAAGLPARRRLEANIPVRSAKTCSELASALGRGSFENPFLEKI